MRRASDIADYEAIPLHNRRNRLCRSSFVCPTSKICTHLIAEADLRLAPPFPSYALSFADRLQKVNVLCSSADASVVRYASNRIQQRVSPSHLELDTANRTSARCLLPDCLPSPTARLQHDQQAVEYVLIHGAQ